MNPEKTPISKSQQDTTFYLNLAIGIALLSCSRYLPEQIAGLDPTQSCSGLAKAFENCPTRPESAYRTMAYITGFWPAVIKFVGAPLSTAARLLAPSTQLAEQIHASTSSMTVGSALIKPIIRLGDSCPGFTLRPFDNNCTQKSGMPSGHTLASALIPVVGGLVAAQRIAEGAHYDFQVLASMICLNIVYAATLKYLPAMQSKLSQATNCAISEKGISLVFHLTMRAVDSISNPAAVFANLPNMVWMLVDHKLQAKPQEKSSRRTPS